jgi:hypothetical protein
MHPCAGLGPERIAPIADGMLDFIETPSNEP